MVCPLFHGQVEGSWPRNPHAQTPLLHQTSDWQSWCCRAEKAEQLKMLKYTHLDFSYKCVPIADDTNGVFEPQLLHFVKDLGCHLLSATKDPSSPQHFIERLSVAVQRDNAASVLGTIGQQDGLDF